VVQVPGAQGTATHGPRKGPTTLGLMYRPQLIEKNHETIKPTLAELGVIWLNELRWRFIIDK
jgi:hypothetical protein